MHSPCARPCRFSDKGLAASAKERDEAVAMPKASRPVEVDVEVEVVVHLHASAKLTRKKSKELTRYDTSQSGTLMEE